MDRTVVLNKHETVVDLEDWYGLIERVNKLEKALIAVSAWDLPEAECQGRRCSYESAYGSNGAREYIRKVAMRALDKN